MDKLYLFAIGGSGARVLRSFTMMLATGVDLGVKEIVPIIIDPDKSNADLTRTVSLMNSYKTIRSSLNFPAENNNQFFKCDIQKISNNYELHLNDTDDKSFKEFIDLSSMGNSNQAMFKMLFSEKNLESSMEVGFKGNPNIGSVVLNQIVDSEDFDAFANSFDEGDKIFIISSIFGGTGASGFPLLLKTLRTGSDFPNYDIINKAVIGAITILPYFKLAKSEDSEIDSSTFISKTKSALAYYENNIIKNKSINSLYFIGDDISNIYENNEGGVSQQNNAHLIEFLSGTAIFDFVNRQITPDVLENNEFGIKDTEDTVTFNSFCDEEKRLLFSPLTQFLLMSNCFIDKIGYFKSSDFHANNDNFKKVYDMPFFNQLKTFCVKYKEWLSEMKGNKRSLDLFNLISVDNPFDIVTGIKAHKTFSLKSGYSLVADRLNSSISKCNSKEETDKLLEMYTLGTKRLFDEKFNKG